MALALLALIVLPSAAALETEAVFIVQSRIRVASPTIEGPAIALCVVDNHELALDHLVLRAPALNVSVYRSQGVGALESTVTPLAGFYTVLNRRGETFTLHNVTLRLVSQDGFGYVGINGGAGARARLDADVAAFMAPSVRSEISTSVSSDPDPRDASRYYYAEISQPHVFADGAGPLTFTGPGKAKLYGMVLEWAADENSSRIALGRSSPTPGVIQDTWLVVEGADLHVEVSTPRPWQAAFSQASVDWSGEARFRAVDGRVSTPTLAYTARPGAIAVVGSFHGDIQTEVRRGDPFARFDLQGDLSSTTLAAASAATAPVPAEATLAPWLTLAAAAVVAGAAGGALLLRRRRPTEKRVAPRPRASPTPDQAATPERCVAQAHAFLEQGDMRQALHWIGLARRAAPTSASVCLTQAFLLGELGEVDQALHAYREAARLAPGDAEPSLCAARLAHQSGRPHEVTEDLLEQALARDPTTVQEIDSDRFFDALSGRPRFDHMVEAAWKRHVANLSEPE